MTKPDRHSSSLLSRNPLQRTVIGQKTPEKMKPVGFLRRWIIGQHNADLIIPREDYLFSDHDIPVAAKGSGKTAALLQFFSRIPFEKKEMVTHVEKLSARNKMIRFRVHAMQRRSLMKRIQGYEKLGYAIHNLVFEADGGTSTPKTLPLPRPFPDITPGFLRHFIVICAFVMLLGALFAIHQDYQETARQKAALNASLRDLVARQAEERRRAELNKQEETERKAFARDQIVITAILAHLNETAGEDNIIESIAFEDGDLSLSGTSSDPDQFLQDLGAIKPWSGAQFVGPVLKEPTSDRQRFIIELK